MARVFGQGTAANGHAEREGECEVCFLVHGMGGDPQEDWAAWVDILGKRFPTWKVCPVDNLSKGAKPMGSSPEELAAIAAKEMVAFLRKEIPDGDTASLRPRLVMHCVGHSMGGLIVRGALPLVAEMMGSDLPQLGHYMSLSSPQLGTQASWLAPFHAFRNLAGCTAWASNQLLQMAVQDVGENGQPYLVALADPSGPYMKNLAKFRRCTCVALAAGDALISVPSALCDHNCVQGRRRFTERSFWRFEWCLGLDPASEFMKLYGGSPAKPKGIPLLDLPFHLLLNLLGLLLWTLALGLAPIAKLLLLLFRARAARAKKDPDSATAKAKAKMHGSAEQVQPLIAESEAAAAKQSRWMLSKDGTNLCPGSMVRGLATLPWQRILVTAHVRPSAKNKHVFLIGKNTEQHVGEHQLSRNCIEQLVEIFAD